MKISILSIFFLSFFPSFRSFRSFFSFFYFLSFFLSFFFLSSPMHNSKTIRCVKILSITNGWSATGNHSCWFSASCELRLASYGPETVANTLCVLFLRLLGLLFMYRMAPNFRRVKSLDILVNKTFVKFSHTTTTVITGVYLPKYSQ